LNATGARIVLKKVGVKLSSLIESRLLLACRQPKQDLIQGATQDCMYLTPGADTGLMNVCMIEWMDEWMGGWMDEWMNE